MIEYLTLAGVGLIGLGLAAQGWFILDLNRRITRIMTLALNQNNESQVETTQISELSKKLSKDKATIEGLGDSAKTHLLGGLYANGDAVCHIDCWCKIGDGEE
jgi:hypothetical protein